MDISKKEYQENRAAGRRGQGQYPQTIKLLDIGVTKNRKQRRERVSATKRKPYLTDAWLEMKQQIKQRVLRQEAASRS